MDSTDVASGSEMTFEEIDLSHIKVETDLSHIKVEVASDSEGTADASAQQPEEKWHISRETEGVSVSVSADVSHVKVEVASDSEGTATSDVFAKHPEEKLHISGETEGVSVSVSADVSHIKMEVTSDSEGTANLSDDEQPEEDEVVYQCYRSNKVSACCVHAIEEVWQGSEVTANLSEIFEQPEKKWHISGEAGGVSVSVSAGNEALTCQGPAINKVLQEGTANFFDAFPWKREKNSPVSLVKTDTGETQGVSVSVSAEEVIYKFVCCRHVMKKDWPGNLGNVNLSAEQPDRKWYQCREASGVSVSVSADEVSYKCCESNNLCCVHAMKKVWQGCEGTANLSEVSAEQPEKQWHISEETERVSVSVSVPAAEEGIYKGRKVSVCCVDAMKKVLDGRRTAPEQFKRRFKRHARLENVGLSMSSIIARTYKLLRDYSRMEQNRYSVRCITGLMGGPPWVIGIGPPPTDLYCIDRGCRRIVSRRGRFFELVKHIKSEHKQESGDLILDVMVRYSSFFTQMESCLQFDLDYISKHYQGDKEYQRYERSHRYQQLEKPLGVIGRQRVRTYRR